VTVDIDGVSAQKAYPLKTHDCAVAHIKLRRSSTARTSPNHRTSPWRRSDRSDALEEAARRVVGS
jgi:hypothetical protein